MSRSSPGVPSSAQGDLVRSPGQAGTRPGRDTPSNYRAELAGSVEDHRPRMFWTGPFAPHALSGPFAPHALSRARPGCSYRDPGVLPRSQSIPEAQRRGPPWPACLSWRTSRAPEAKRSRVLVSFKGGLPAPCRRHRWAGREWLGGDLSPSPSTEWSGASQEPNPVSDFVGGSTSCAPCYFTMTVSAKTNPTSITRIMAAKYSLSWRIPFED